MCDGIASATTSFPVTPANIHIRFGQRGYDILLHSFFVDLYLTFPSPDDGSTTGTSLKSEKKTTKFFSSFSSYFNFLRGNIYTNACYYGHRFSKSIATKYNLNLSAMNFTAFTDQVIFTVLPAPSSYKQGYYDGVEKRKELICEQISLLNACKSSDEFVSLFSEFVSPTPVSSTAKAKDHDVTPYESGFSSGCSLWRVPRLLPFLYISFSSSDPWPNIEALLSSSAWIGREQLLALCEIFGYEKILSAYHPSSSPSTKYGRLTLIRKFLNSSKTNPPTCQYKNYFDKETHFFCSEKSIVHTIYGDEMPALSIKTYFDSFSSFCNYLDNDLRNCDFSAMSQFDFDISSCIVDETTLFPIDSNDCFKCNIKKYYHENRFFVEQEWLRPNGQVISTSTASFNHFCDFAFFLRGDLSNADLLNCKGIKNVLHMPGINFANVKIRSCETDSLSISQLHFQLPSTFSALSFATTVENERAHKLTRKCDHSSELSDEYFAYITDLHIVHKLLAKKAKSDHDIEFELHNIAEDLCKSADSLISPFHFQKTCILIGGDVSSDFEIFKLFISIFKDTLVRYGLDSYVTIVFTLGNHELWSFPNAPLEDIVRLYRSYLSSFGMYLLQNDLLFSEDLKTWKSISSTEILNYTRNELRHILQYSRLALFGSIGFAGYNSTFNANNEIYRGVISRVQEIQESSYTERVYDTIANALGDKNVIVLTHMPFEDWHKNASPYPGFIHISGHNHKNLFYDDGETRLYSDNQIGYRNRKCSFKFGAYATDYDLFSDYEDGIYPISREQYVRFYHGLNESMEFNRDIGVLYMLKKHGYYLFLHQSPKHFTYVLDKGNQRRYYSENKPVEFYYDNMDKVINRFTNPLTTYSIFQKNVSDFIRSFGGSGFIHGAIVDIDYFTHVYVNPYDGKITGYYASDIVNKIVYPNIPSLLKSKCPSLYRRYLKLIDSSTKQYLPANVSDYKKGVKYLSTDIYKASLFLKRLQSLHFHVLRAWIPEIDLPQKSIENSEDIHFTK